MPLKHDSESQRQRMLKRWSATTREYRFWKDVLKDPDGCWFRIGSKEGRYDGERHRTAWELTNGPIPKGKNVLHRCDNRRCCRPDHLFVGTQQENINDMIEKGRQARGKRLKHPPQNGENNYAAKLTTETVRKAKAMLTAGARQCDVMKATGISRSNIWNIAHGYTWKDV